MCSKCSELRRAELAQRAAAAIALCCHEVANGMSKRLARSSRWWSTRERFALLQYPEAAVLFDRRTYRCVPLSPALHELMTSFREPRRVPPDATLAALVGRGILRAAAPG